MEPRVDVHNVNTAGSPRVTEGASGVRRGQLRVGDIMSRDVVTAALDDTVSSAVKRMSEHYVSCLVVMNDGHVTGILTEKDLLKGVGGRNPAFHALRVSDQMSSPVKLVSPDASIIEAGRIMETNRIRRLPVVQDGLMVGIVTQTDITRGLISLTPLRCVADIMTRRVTAVAADATIAEAARIMSSCNISCLIVMIRGEVAGILSEKDLMAAMVSLDCWNRPIGEVMKPNVICYEEQTPIQIIYEFLCRVSIRRVVIADRGCPTGTISRGTLLRWFRNLVVSRGLLERATVSTAPGETDPYRSKHRLAETTNELADQVAALERHLDNDAEDLGPPVVGGVTRMQELLDDLLAYSRYAGSSADHAARQAVLLGGGQLD